jgi:hypothetical protein
MFVLFSFGFVPAPPTTTTNNNNNNARVAPLTEHP